MIALASASYSRPPLSVGQPLPDDYPPDRKCLTRNLWDIPMHTMRLALDIMWIVIAILIHIEACDMRTIQMTEVFLSNPDGMPRDCAINCDLLQTVSKAKIGAVITSLPPGKMADVGRAIRLHLIFSA